MNSTLFDTWSKNYENDLIRLENEYPFAGYQTIISEIIEIIDKGSNINILDIGIGSGYLLNKLIEKLEVDDYFGLDFSPKMLEIANTKFLKEKLLLHDIINGVPNAINEHKFSDIISTYTLHHFNLDTKIEIIEKYMKVLRSNGNFIIADISFNSKNKLNEVKSKEGDGWDKDEEDGYFISTDFINAIQNKGYKITYKEISFCSAIYTIKNKK